MAPGNGPGSFVVLEACPHHFTLTATAVINSTDKPAAWPYYKYMETTKRNAPKQIIERLKKNPPSATAREHNEAMAEWLSEVKRCIAVGHADAAGNAAMTLAWHHRRWCEATGLRYLTD